MHPSPAELAWTRLAMADGIGPVTSRRLIERKGDVVRAAAATLSDLRAAAGETRAPRLLAALRRVDPRTVWDEARANAQRVLTPAAPDWPAERFLGLSDPPLALFLRGDLPTEPGPVVGIVGSRAAGAYGVRLAREIAEDLACRGVWIVSGLALGVDGAAHAGALAAPAGRTSAFLGCGLDVAYPLEHLDLREEVVQRGGVATEHPPGTKPQPGFFPRRNRLVAALADAVVVVAATGRSGALSTARHALALGRELLAVPGPVGAAHRGSNRLLKQGAAALCEDASDVLAVLSLSGAPAATRSETPRAPPPSGAPLALYGVLERDEVVTADDLCLRTGLDAATVTDALALLEIEGYVARVPGVGVRRVG